MKRIISASVLLLFVLMYACNSKQSENRVWPIAESSQSHLSGNPITILEAQEWFQKYGLSPNLRIANENNKGRSVRWEKAGYYNFPFGKVVIVPINYKVSHTPKYFVDVNKLKGKKETPKISISDSDLDFLIVYKDNQKNYHEEVIQVIPDEDYLVKSNSRNKKMPYEGLIVISNWNGDLIQGYKYENGQAVGKITNKKNLRMADVQPLTTCETVDWYSCASSGQGWDCSYSHSNTICTTSYVDTGGGWSYSYGDWASGGGGSGGYTFEEEVETIETPAGTFVFPDETQIARKLCIPKNEVHTAVTIMKSQWRSKFSSTVGSNPDVGYE